MNKMKLEAIKHEEAKKAAKRTEYDWTDLLDNTAEIDRHAPANEEEIHDYYARYFEEIIIALNYE